MDRFHIAAAEERRAEERLKQKLNEVKDEALVQLATVQDHVNFTLQKAYFTCGVECFDRSKTQHEINQCLERCSYPVVRAQELVEKEIVKFEERLQKSVMACQEKYELAKLAKKAGNEPRTSLESCIDYSIQEGIAWLPHIAKRLKATLPVPD